MKTDLTTAATALHLAIADLEGTLESLESRIDEFEGQTGTDLAQAVADIAKIALNHSRMNRQSLILGCRNMIMDLRRSSTFPLAHAQIASLIEANVEWLNARLNDVNKAHANMK